MIPALSAIPGVVAALSAGLLSFLSPCVLPLVPVYISFISGESSTALRAGTMKRSTVLVRTLFFISGFTLVFVATGLIFGGGMRFAGSGAGIIINRIAGILIIILGINMIIDLIPFLRGVYKFNVQNDRIDRSENSGKKKEIPAPIRSILFGMGFAAGWTPCIGPILSSILLFAAQGANPAYAAFLLFSYSIGLAIPFLLAALFLSKALPLFDWLKRHGTAVRVLSGILLSVFGILILAGSFAGLSSGLMKAGYYLEETSISGPEWFRPVAGFISRWFSFRGI